VEVRALGCAERGDGLSSSGSNFGFRGGMRAAITSKRARGNARIAPGVFAFPAARPFRKFPMLFSRFTRSIETILIVEDEPLVAFD
ncbi:hypothetical protein K4G94_22440, partial [Mycobacterium tuberculosis]|uniref:hypothetical protein n=1 Tax=Mycobacterium tuberculosis TaxID=1773 RepID=UPI001C7D0290|nr:hypothetical protein [Mycobacterium tuberculosis]